MCVYEKKDDVWKIRHIQKYLKDSVLILYINNCLHILHWVEFILLFLENYGLMEGLPLEMKKISLNKFLQRCHRMEKIGV